MRNLFVVLLLSLGSLELNAQNLVPNPSFEDTVSCPTTANQLDKCANWWPSLESPDYFHECDFVTGLTGIPNNYCGFQYANTGSAYVGFIPFTRTALNGREYFTCQLLAPLTIGTSYQVSYYLNWSAGLGKKIACNKIGVFFSTTNFNLLNPLQIQNFAHVFTDSIITDSINWVKISSLFVADSNYTFLSIGNLFDDTLTDTISFDPSAHAFYYIDDVSVIPDSLSSLSIDTQSGYSIYPNPFQDRLRIEAKEKDNNKIKIFNMLGQPVYIESSFYEKTIDLSLESLSMGVYILFIESIHNTVIVKKIIKN